MTGRPSNLFLLQCMVVVALCSSTITISADELDVEQQHEQQDGPGPTILLSAPPPTATTELTQQNCSNHFDKVTNICVGIACAALAVNLAGLISFIVYNRYLFENPKRGLHFFFSMAVITLIFGVGMLFSILLMSCSDGCDCQSLNDYMAIPIVLVAKGILWLAGGIAYYTAASTHQQYEKTNRLEATVVLAAFELDDFEKEQGNAGQQQDVESGSRNASPETTVVVQKKRGANT
jgi:hypothetical protein